MLITKFNALIRNRFIWGFFAVLVSITMVGFFTDIGGCIQGKQPLDTVGSLDDKPVAYRELQAARFNVILRIRLSTGRDFHATPEIDKLVTREAWKRLAMLRLAAKEQLGTSDAEVATHIQRDPMFQENGQFRPERFENVLQQLGTHFGIGPTQFEEYLREELTLEKIRRTVSAASWSAPAEVDRLARNFADSFTVSYLEFPRASLTRDITVADDQIQAYYDTHTNDFAIPDKVQVAYVAFPLTNYAASAEIPAEAVTNYYADHLNDYFTTNAAGEPLARRIEEVESEIRTLLTNESRREKAYEDAARFADSLFGKGDQPNFFTAAAAATGKLANITRFFALDEPLDELGAGTDFNSAAFAMSQAKDSNFSEPIQTPDAFFVIAYEGSQPARVPPLEEVRVEARALALAEASNQAIEERGPALVKRVQAAIRAGQSFEKAAETENLIGLQPLKKVGPFTAYTAPAPFDNARFVTAILSLQEGEISELVESERNTLVLIRCDTRTPGDMSAMDPIRNQIRSSLNRRHAQLLVNQWENELLKKMGYQEPVSDDETAEQP
ncbi:MAG: SurA N-terminal domain-containing protein [Kiritimatiellia bacterium]